MLKRSGFSRKTLERQPPSPPQPIRKTALVTIGEAVARPKVAPVRSEAYRRLVAALPCYNCGVQGYSQAAHADEGKGLGLKSSDLTCYPLCAARPGIPGCHYQIGTAGLFTRERRRIFEKAAVADTQEKLSKTRPNP